MDPHQLPATQNNALQQYLYLDGALWTRKLTDVKTSCLGFLQPEQKGWYEE